MAGVRVNKTLKIRDWTRANEIVRDWEIAGTVRNESPKASMSDACQSFLGDVEAQQLSDASLKKYRVLLVNPRPLKHPEKYSPSLLVFCGERGIQFPSEISLRTLMQFRSEWKDGAISGGKKLERLRAFGRFLVDHGWWPENLVLKLKRPKVSDPPTMPYTRKEIEALLSACDRYIDWRGRTGQDNAHRLRAFLLFLRYSGLRIGDAASCAADRLTGNRLFLYTQKTGVPVYIPLPPFVVEALASCPRRSARYWFWTGTASKETLTGNWRRTFRRLCDLAVVKGGHPHRFRDTLAVDLLLEGVPIERVSILLGHSSVKITERHYAPWVQARQAQLESDLERVWRKDPLAQTAMLAGDTAIQDAPAVGMAATYSRHESTNAPN